MLLRWFSLAVLNLFCMHVTLLVGSGALGSAVTKKKRDSKSKDETEELKLLEAAEAVVRTTRVGILPESQLVENLQRLLNKFTGPWDDKPTAHLQQEQISKPVQQKKMPDKTWYEHEEWPQPSSQKNTAKHQTNRQVVWNATVPASNVSKHSLPASGNTSQ